MEVIKYLKIGLWNLLTVRNGMRRWVESKATLNWNNQYPLPYEKFRNLDRGQVYNYTIKTEGTCRFLND